MDQRPLLEYLIATGPTVIFRRTPENDVTYVSPNVERILGYSPDEVRGTPGFWSAKVHPDDRDRFDAQAQEAFAREVPELERDYRFLHADGTYRWIHARDHIEYDASGAPESLLGYALDMTERRSAEEQMVRLWGFPLALLFVAGLDGYFKRVSVGYEKLLGWTEHELLSRPFFEFLHPDDLATLGASMQEVAAGRTEVINQEIRVLCKDGTYRWLMGNYRPALDEGLMYGMAIDITERKQAEEALRENERRTRLILDTAYEAFVSMDIDGRIVDWNAEAERVFGWSREDAMGRALVETIVPERYRTSHLEGLDRYRKTGEGPVLGRRFEIEALRRDGSEFPVELTISPTRLDDSVLFNAFLRDITQRKQADEAIREREAALQALFAASPDLITMVGPGGELAPASHAVRDILGYEPEEYSQMDRTSLIHPDDRDGVEEGLRSLLQGGPPLVNRFRVSHAHGHWVVLESHSRAMIDADGRVRGLTAVARDVTERAALEEALQSAKDEADRAKQQAELANRAKSEFLSRMSHELRTPLNAILGFGQLLETDELDADQRDSVEHILRAGKHLLQLIDEVLDVARIEQGRIALSIEPVHLDDVVRDALDLVRPLAAAANVDITMERSQFDRHVLADRQRLKQVLMNLLSNAVKYNRDGGTVIVSCHLAENGRLRIAVADTGPGIPSEMMDRLFLPFERLGAERTPVEGTGIGLSISKSLVELMGGEIGAENETGRGATFWVELEEAEPPEERAAPAVEGEPEVAAAWGGARTVLYVEDNLSNLRLVERILARRQAVRLIATMQGGMALELARQHHPDLILLDVHLPDIEGDEVLRRLREDPETRDIPVVAVSAEATPRKIERFLAAGTRAYLTKPLDVKQFLEVVDGILAETTT